MEKRMNQKQGKDKELTKRILVLILALSTSMSMFGCNKSGDENNDDDYDATKNVAETFYEDDNRDNKKRE